ncbi:two-component sensor histidine kinase [Thiocapsa imhoffii]|uniref:histidine kinase n=1 Tax=Thiocapsa imhoffii TaxID=382777 RepID=A0A9X0WK79_9GAMM|nr:ATP-binding protein [Thiocapsa imhoffii]MBK1646061.1 two-component sensor histidine kinase [Thiocapsa imhoffii]
MTLSIHAKVFLTLLLACVLVLLGTLAFVHWSLQRGLIELADAREQARVEVIAERLTEIHARDGSWDALKGSPQQWIGALFGLEGAGSGRRLRPSEGRRLPPLVRRLLESESLMGGDGGAGWPPSLPPRPAHHDGTPRNIPIELRLMLLDVDGTLLYGQPELLSRSRRLALEWGGQPIGSLAIIPGPPVAELADLHFVERQGGRLVLFVLAMLALAAILADPLSRRLIRPVQAVQQIARTLAAGDYSARVRATGNDELSRLGADIDALAAALEQTDRARRQWVADISHELRTPIALLRAHLEAMQDGVRPLEHSAIDRLHGDVLRLSRLVDDLQDLAMTDLGALTYRMRDTDLADILADEIEQYRARFEQARLDLIFENRLDRPSGEATRLGRHAQPRLWADPDRLAQLFGNLLRNSLSYTDPGGALRVTLARGPDGAYRIRFADTAPGVPAADLPHLFDRLYRVDHSRSRNTGGAGLGLAIAKNVVEAHGGTITAAAAETGGCEILITLPTLMRR